MFLCVLTFKDVAGAEVQRRTHLHYRAPLPVGPKVSGHREGGARHEQRVSRKASHFITKRNVLEKWLILIRTPGNKNVTVKVCCS